MELQGILSSPQISANKQFPKHGRWSIRHVLLRIISFSPLREKSSRYPCDKIRDRGEVIVNSKALLFYICQHIKL